MNHDYAEIHESLLAKREELSNRLERIKENLTAGRSADSQEQAQELENAEVVDALGNEARLELSKNFPGTGTNEGRHLWHLRKLQ